MADNTQARLPTPDPALRALDRFVGTWSMEGHLVGSDEITIKGQTTFRWRPGGLAPSGALIGRSRRVVVPCSAALVGRDVVRLR
jgi:hypothetical protein